MRLKPALHISAASPQQELHSWYVKLVSTSFRGKLMVMYVHDPSLTIVLTNGKTIAGTLEEFYTRLEALLNRNYFDRKFIDKEMQLIKEGYVISKTNSRSILGSMNTISENIEYRCSNYTSFEAINLDAIEDSYMEWLSSIPGSYGKYKRTIDYWKAKGLIV